VTRRQDESVLLLTDSEYHVGARNMHRGLPPYPGQGTPLPDGSYEGNWVIENSVFICKLPDISRDVPYVGLEMPTGIIADGFNAEILAHQLEITVEQLFDFNSLKMLIVERRKVETQRGADITVQYDFCTPMSGISVGLSRAAIRGRA
jgi:hypothetical protein